LKSEIIKLRKKIFKNLKAKALAHERALSKQIITYQKDQTRYSKREFQESNIDELMGAVSKTDIIYLGDFHTFDQNIRNVLRVLKLLINKNNKCIIGLEMVDASYQFYIDTYMQGHITELEFLECIDYHDSWRFPWIHYKLIFELAKKHNMKVIGLNTDNTLIKRDDFAADMICKTKKNYTDSQILVVYGELHITPNKIPSTVSKANEKIKQVIIHQNLDEVYWKQIENNSDHKIIKFTDQEYCINSAPPWIKYESMIYWYENLCDDPDFDIHDYIIENGKKFFSDDTRDNFLQYCTEMGEAINIKLDMDKLEDFNLHDHTNLDYVEEKISGLKSKSLINFYQHLVATGQSFRLPMEHTYYCSSYSMNRIAYLSGAHIYHYYLELADISPYKVYSSTDQNKKFILLTMETMFSYFFSKVINPHRKCEMYLDLRNKTAQENNSADKEVLTLSAQILDDASLNNKLSGVRLKRIHEMSLYIGHILGEYLYEGIFNQEQEINIENFLNKNVLEEFNFQRFKKVLLKGVKYKTHTKRVF